jgi:hypothetical protein
MRLQALSAGLSIRDYRYFFVTNTIQKVGRFVKQPTQINPIPDFQLT